MVRAPFWVSVSTCNETVKFRGRRLNSEGDNCLCKTFCILVSMMTVFYFKIMIPFSLRGSPGGSVVKNLSANQEMWVRSLGQKISWRRKWQSNPVLLPGKYYGKRSLAGYSPCGRRVRHDLALRGLLFHPRGLSFRRGWTSEATNPPYYISDYCNKSPLRFWSLWTPKALISLSSSDDNHFLLIL